MEFREYLKIIKKYKKIFFSIWGVILLLPLFTLFVQPTVYNGEQTILIGRNNLGGVIKTSDEYDYYYQLEADKRLANMLVQFLGDKALLQNVFSNLSSKTAKKIGGDNFMYGGISKEETKWISSHLRGKTMDGGYIKIIILSHNKNVIKSISKQLIEQLNIKISKVSIDKNRMIKLNPEAVVITRKDKIYLPLGLGAFFGGLLVSIFTVLSIHYLKKEE